MAQSVGSCAIRGFSAGKTSEFNRNSVMAEAEAQDVIVLDEAIEASMEVEQERKGEESVDVEAELQKGDRSEEKGAEQVAESMEGEGDVTVQGREEAVGIEESVDKGPGPSKPQPTVGKAKGKGLKRKRKKPVIDSDDSAGSDVGEGSTWKRQSAKAGKVHIPLKLL